MILIWCLFRTCFAPVICTLWIVRTYLSATDPYPTDRVDIDLSDVWIYLRVGTQTKLKAGVVVANSKGGDCYGAKYQCT